MKTCNSSKISPILTYINGLKSAGKSGITILRVLSLGEGLNR